MGHRARSAAVKLRLTLLTAASLGMAVVVASCSSGSSSTASGPKASTAPTESQGQAQTGGPEASPTGDIPDNQAYVAFTPPTGGFSVKVPEGWARTDVNGAVVFSDKLNSIRVEAAPDPNAPTVQTVQSTEVPGIQAAAKGFQMGNVSAAQRKAGNAVLVKYKADSSPDPVTGKTVRQAVERYEFWRNGTKVVLTLSGPEGADNVDPWRTVTDSFTWQ